MDKANYSARLVEHVKKLDTGVGVTPTEIKRYLQATFPDEVDGLKNTLKKCIKLGFLELDGIKVKIPVSLQEEVNRLKSIVSFQAKQISLLNAIQDSLIERFDKQLEELEQASKKKSVQINGIQHWRYEGVTPECAARDFVWRFLDVSVGNLGIESAQWASDVSLLVTFTTHEIKRDIMRRARYLRYPLSVVDDLTQHRHQILDAAKERFGSNRVIVEHGKIYYINDAGLKCEAQSLSDVNRVESVQATSESLFLTKADVEFKLKAMEIENEEFWKESPPKSMEPCVGPIVVESDDSD